VLKVLVGLEEITQTDFSRLPWPESPKEQVMGALRFLLADSLSEYPKRRREETELVELNNLAWVFIADRNFKPQPVRTWSAFQKKFADAVYFTPNTFYSRKAKVQNALRWLNAVFVDIDDPYLCGLDVRERCWEVGLPQPMLVAKTPHGLHVYWKIKRVRATPKAVKLYTTVLRAVVAALGGDPQAATPEHFMRLPRCILEFAPREYPFAVFCNWYREEYLSGEVLSSGEKGPVFIRRDILEHPAVRVLQEGVEKGRRDNTAFTLALCYKVAGYSREETLRELLAWNRRNKPPLPASQVMAKVRSAYKPKYHGPRSKWLSLLSGISFCYRRISRKSATERRSRKRDRAKEDFLKLLEVSGGKIVTLRSRLLLADKLGISPATLNRALQELVAEGRITVLTRRLGKGKGAQVVYALHHEAESVGSTYQIQKPSPYLRTTTEIGGANNVIKIRNTYLDEGRVGKGQPPATISAQDQCGHQGSSPLRGTWVQAALYHIKMAVEAKYVADLQDLYHREAHGIRVGEFLVPVFLQDRAPLPADSRVGVDHGECPAFRSFFDRLEEPQRQVEIAVVAEPGVGFRHHQESGNQARLFSYRQVKSLGCFVKRIPFIYQSDEGTRVHEDLRGGGRHRRGPPCKSLSRYPDRRKSR
jgi:DNA-binding Lrp family transcriptional regulator